MKNQLKILLLIYVFTTSLAFAHVSIINNEIPKFELQTMNNFNNTNTELLFITLYQSLYTKLSTWYTGLVGCVFGIFSIMLILYQEKDEVKKFIFFIIGEMIILITGYIFYKAWQTYIIIISVEKSFILNNVSLFDWYTKLNKDFAFYIFQPIDILSGWGLKQLLLIIYGVLLFLIIPCAIINFYLLLEKKNGKTSYTLIEFIKIISNKLDIKIYHLTIIFLIIIILMVIFMKTVF